MQQQQQQRPSRPRTKPPEPATRTVSGSYSVMSESTSNRRAMLGQSYYDDAKKFISQALTADEGGDRMLALELYSKSLSSIRSGLASLQSSVGAEGAPNSALQDIHGKMERMKEQVKSRMEDLLQSEIKARALSKSVRPHPSAPPLSSSVAASTMGQASAVATPPASVGGEAREAAKANVLFNMDTGISLFEVDHKDHVRKYNDVDAFTLFKYHSHIEGQPPAFLQCGGFVYPLVPGKSPILKSGDRMYMFPQLKSEDGSSVGVALESASQAEIEELDRLLSQLADLKTVEEVAEGVGERSQVGVAKGEDPKWGSSVAGGIDKGVSWVSTKITQGTEVAGNLIIKGANKLQEHIKPNEQATEVPASVQKGVHYTRKASEYVVGVSDFLMTSLARLTVKVGSGIKEKVEESEYAKKFDVNPHVKETWKVTKSGLKGAADVFIDLKRGAVAVVQGVGQATSRTVGHKYGPEAEKVADDSLATVGNTTSVVATYWSWKTWGITLLGKVGEVVSKEPKEKGAGTS